MNELALFAGAGGSILAGHLLGWRTVCAVEIDAYCRSVLMQRQDEGILDPFPIWDDVRTFDGVAWRGRVDVITAGFPCQPFSHAGKMRGADDGRNMWPETIRIIRDVRPRFCLLENVPGLLSGRKRRIRWHTVERSLFGRIRASHHATISLPPYFATVLGDLAACGYDARWRVLSAAELGAPHKRDRLWIVAHSDIPRLEVGPRVGCDDGEKLQAAERSGNEWPGWPTEPAMGRVADGVANRVDQLRALGNGWVPRVGAAAWLLLKEKP